MKATKIKSIDEVLEESTTITADSDEIAPDTYTEEISGYRVSTIDSIAIDPTAHYVVDLLPTGYISTPRLAMAHLEAIAKRTAEALPNIRELGLVGAVKYIFKEGTKEPIFQRGYQKAAHKAIEKSNPLLAEYILPEEIQISLDGMGITAQVNGANYRDKELTKDQVKELNVGYELEVSDMIEIMPSEFPVHYRRAA